MRWKPSKRGVFLALSLVLAGVTVGAILWLRLPWIRAETVRFHNGDVTWVGTLAVPRWRDGPYPAVVIVEGSGTFTRWLYWLYVRRLVPLGMAVLIYDKRGAGESSGTYAQGKTWSIEVIANCGDTFNCRISPIGPG